MSRAKGHIWLLSRNYGKPFYTYGISRAWPALFHHSDIREISVPSQTTERNRATERDDENNINDFIHLLT
jgi:hypothetical protein